MCAPRHLSASRAFTTFSDTPGTFVRHEVSDRRHVVPRRRLSAPSSFKERPSVRELATVGRRCAVGSPTGRAGCPKTLDHATLHDPVLAHESADHRATACPRRYRGSPLLDVMRVSP